MSDVEYFQHLGLEETFGRLFHVFGKRWAVFLSISVLAYFIIVMVTMASMAFVLPLLMKSTSSSYSNNDDDGDYDATAQMTIMYAHYFAVMLVDSAIYYVIMCVADGAIIRAVAEIYIERVPTVYYTLRQGVYKLGTLFCTSTLIGVVVGIPAMAILGLIVVVADSRESVFMAVMLFALVVWCFLIWLSVVTYHIYPSIMVENQGIISSIKRSWELSSGHRCHIFTCLLIFFFVKMILSQIFKSIGANGGEGALLVAETLSTILNVLFASFGSILQAIVYLNVRVKEEGLNGVLLSAELFAGSDGAEDETPYMKAGEAEMTENMETETEKENTIV